MIKDPHPELLDIKEGLIVAPQPLQHGRLLLLNGAQLLLWRP